MSEMLNNYGEYEVVVVGGGFAGTFAAIASAREGKSVLLIEKYNALGGAAVYDLVNPFMPYFTWDKDNNFKLLSKGLFWEFIEKMRGMGGMLPGSFHVFNEEYLKLLLQRMCRESGVKILFNTIVTDVFKDKNQKITSVEIFNVSGKQNVNGKVFIDATGDGDLSSMAGFSFHVGREEDGLCQPMTTCFRLAGVDLELYEKEKASINPLYKQYKEEGKISNPREDVLIFSTLLPNVLHFNTTRVVKLNPTNADDVTKAEMIAREQIFELYDFLKNNFECFRNAQIAYSGIRIGARESRMIDGLHTLTREEICSFTKFDDGIAACNYEIDIHSPDGSGTSHWFFPRGEYYTIPYRCLVPKESKNLLVAGRCISVTHEVQASVRIMPVCACMGEAAGVSASILVDSGNDTKDIDILKLRQRLIELNCEI